MKKYDFQYCQKIVVYSKDESSVLLCRRKGENDFDNVFSFIGGKMEITDVNIINGLKREKNEEVGRNFKIKIFPTFCTTLSYVKKDGHTMILPHYYAIHKSGHVKLNSEYSEFKWVPLKDISTFKPKITTIPDVLKKLAILKNIINQTKSIII